MFLLVFIEQTRNYAKARIALKGILVRNQALAGWEEKPANNFPGPSLAASKHGKQE
jgi:hypothetical protein